MGGSFFLWARFWYNVGFLFGKRGIVTGGESCFEKTIWEDWQGGLDKVGGFGIV